MAEGEFRGRLAVSVENEQLRVTVLPGGGHIAEVFDKRAGVSPLWKPHWASMEPEAFGPEQHAEFGTGVESRLLAGIMGANLCLDLFGGPSEEEFALGIGAHGEASVCRYDVAAEGEVLRLRGHLPLAQLEVTRTLRLQGGAVEVTETVENLQAVDRAIGWTQHVTLGRPFLDPERTEFRASMGASKVIEGEFGADDYLRPGAEFQWPTAPGRDGGGFDLRKMHVAPASGYTAHVVDVAEAQAFFAAYSPEYRLVFGCVWRPSDFPWMGIWEENRSRSGSPWDGREVTRGMEFGVSPFPESRRAMVERGRMLGTRTFGWLPARARLQAVYWMVCREADEVPERLICPVERAQRDERRGRV